MTILKKIYQNMKIPLLNCLYQIKQNDTIVGFCLTLQVQQDGSSKSNESSSNKSERV